MALWIEADTTRTRSRWARLRSHLSQRCVPEKSARSAIPRLLAVYRNECRIRERLRTTSGHRRIPSGARDIFLLSASCRRRLFLLRKSARRDQRVIDAQACSADLGENGAQDRSVCM